MSKSYWLTPEEYQQKKKRGKLLLYSSIFLITMLLSALMTFLMHNV